MYSPLDCDVSWYFHHLERTRKENGVHNSIEADAPMAICDWEILGTQPDDLGGDCSVVQYVCSC